MAMAYADTAKTAVLLDHPTPERPIRLYFAITNRCNRGCPWCSTCSKLKGKTFMDIETFRQLLPTAGAFQVQLEGGEPLCHPERFWEFIRVARAHPECQRLVLCTNGTLLPRRPRGLLIWLDRLGTPFTLKLSLNHFLLDRDPHLVELATLLRDLMGSNPERSLVINVRRSRGGERGRSGDRREGRARRVAAVRERLLPPALRSGIPAGGLGPSAARLGQLPPDQSRRPRVRPDLLARSEAMRLLP